MSKNKAFWIVSGLITIICFIVFKDYLFLEKAYLFTDICSDGLYNSYPQLYNIADYFSKTGFPTWTFKVGMGQNIFPFVLRDPFDIILYLAGKDNIPAVIIYVEVIKIILSGAIFARYLKLLNFSDHTSIAGGLLFAFCGFIMVGSAWFIFTFEAFNFALLLLAFELLYTKQKWFLFPIAVFLYCISLPFNLYIYALFLACYALMRHLHSGKFNAAILGRLFLKMIGLGVLGMLLAGPFLLQNIWVLLHSPRGSDTTALLHQVTTLPVFGLSDKLQIGTGIMRFFSNDILGSSSNFKGWSNILEAPLFYCGLPCLLLLPQALVKGDRRFRIISLIFILAWLVPAVFPYFRWALWLFTGDYYRAYSFFVAFLFLFYSLYALESVFQKRGINMVVLLITLAILLVLLYFPVFIDRNNVDKNIRVIVTIILVAYSALLILASRFSNINLFKAAFFIVLVTELSYTASITANKRDALPVASFKYKFLYNDYYVDAAKYTQDHDPSFFRIDRHFESPSAQYTCLNFNQRQGYNGTSSYNSFNQLYYTRYLQMMGLGKNERESMSWASGLEGHPLLESQNRVKYLLCGKSYQPLWPDLWDSLTTIEDVKILQNKYVLPVGYTYNQYIRESNFNLASPMQKQFITMRAFVVSDKDAGKLNGLKEFILSDTVKEALNSDAFKMAIPALTADTLSLKQFDEKRLDGSITLNEDKMMYVSIPYDEAWNVIVNGTEQRAIIVNGGMSGIYLKKGTHNISMFYKHRFMLKGGTMSLLGLIIFISGYWYYLKRKKTITQMKPDIGQINTEEKPLAVKKYAGKKNVPYMVASFVVVPVIIFLYFLKWKTGTIHGDDLHVQQYYSGLKTFTDKINMSVPYGIFRPVQGLLIYILMEFFNKDLLLIYVFNVLIQVVNTLLFARILNLFLKSPYLSLFIGLIVGLSRFSYYNITQLYNGGVLEGIAMTFFLLFLFSFTEAFVKNDLTDRQKRNRILLSILFANLCMYTHERYLVLFPVIVIAVLLFPAMKALAGRQRLNLILLASGSLVLLLLVKKYILTMRLFMGTGYTDITFSLSSIVSLYIDAVLSIIQINSGMAYLAGAPFSSLSQIEQILAVITACGILIVFIVYLTKALKTFFVKWLAYIRIKESKTRKAFSLKGSTVSNSFFAFILLFLLFNMLLAPAVTQIRIEQRWLQASLSVLVLLFVIAITRIQFKSTRVKNVILILFVVLFVVTDFAYLDKGAKNLYYSTSSTIAKTFDKALRQGVIKPNKTKLYLWVKDRSPDRENEVTWTLFDGYFFENYQGKSLKMVFVDSVYQKTDSATINSFPDFNKDTEQILYLNIQNDDQTFKYTLTDITGEYLKDSLKNFKE